MFQDGYYLNPWKKLRSDLRILDFDSEGDVLGREANLNTILAYKNVYKKELSYLDQREAYSRLWRNMTNYIKGSSEAMSPQITRRRLGNMTMSNALIHCIESKCSFLHCFAGKQVCVYCEYPKRDKRGNETLSLDPAYVLYGGDIEHCRNVSTKHYLGKVTSLSLI